jgi:hypothetical protein
MSLEKKSTHVRLSLKYMSELKLSLKLRVKTLLSTSLSYLKKKSWVSGMFLIYKQNLERLGVSALCGICNEVNLRI